VSEQLRELAAHAGRSAAVDEKLADDLLFQAEVHRREADELDKRARRLKGEAAQHLQDEGDLAAMAERFERAEAALAVSQVGEFCPPRESRARPLTLEEQHKVDRALERFPNAGRPRIVAETGLSDWRVRCYLAGRGASRVGELEEPGAPFDKSLESAVDSAGAPRERVRKRQPRGSTVKGGQRTGPRD
jgi:hypothetical protein